MCQARSGAPIWPGAPENRGDVRRAKKDGPPSPPRGEPFGACPRSSAVVPTALLAVSRGRPAQTVEPQRCEERAYGMRKTG